MNYKELIRLICFMLVIVIFTSMMPLQAYASASDIAGYWAEDVITQWIEKGLVSGYSDGTFRPQNYITRAEFMSLVNNALKFTEETEIDYIDVSGDSWYAKAVKIAKAAGYINGYQDGTVRPDAPITREEAATIITKITNLSLNEKAIEGFKDKDQIKWSKGYIGAVTTAKYMVGFPDGTFKPLNNITRGEAIYALNNIISKEEVKLIAKQDFFGITYIQVVWNKGVKPLSVKANGKDLTYDEKEGKWKGTSLELNIGDTVEIAVLENGAESKATVVVEDILDN
ncbi:Cell surface glycoprotein 2 S-layer protein 2 [Proteiniborus sp. DW1]|uniref:S-layer homology domain-containing protein n=1 Tax=Proteiniborus sp. DW1 TaxID=1889883 RepID=UPI00092E15BE|nr:S-layer homology domain-containing protein [Proteiniborus sp. DW1]SCG81811.1 Cell surface glycoprotein 2 S-layer protein 2 [Proteiniborus sp. DW1]